MTDTENIMFRAALKTALENNFKNPEFRDTPAKGLQQYDRLVKLGRTPEFAFTVLNNCVASEADTAKAIKTIKDVIQEGLTALNKTKTIDSNPTTRLKALIERMNRNAGFFLDGVLIDKQPLSAAEKRTGLVPMPKFLEKQIYTAVASDKSGQKRGEMEVEVRYYRGR